jgi:hypothetical protein
LDFLLGFWLWGLFAFEYWGEAFTLGLLVLEAFRREKIIEGKMVKRG